MTTLQSRMLASILLQQPGPKAGPLLFGPKAGIPVGLVNGPDGCNINGILVNPNLNLAFFEKESKNVLSDSNLVIGTSNYTILQPLKDHLRAKSILSTPGRGTEPFILHHTLKNNPQKSFKDWDTCKYARKLYCEPNAGGKSMNSEAFSVNVLNELYGVNQILTEMEVEYIWYNYKKCDYICTIYEQQVGVSVTRAMGFPDPSHFSEDDADKLLKKKINGLMVARDGVIDKYNFDKCILHVWCESQRIADIIKYRYSLLDLDIKEDIIILLTVTKPFSSPFIYYDKDSDIIRSRVIRENIQ